MKRKHNKVLTPRAKQLRKNMTEQEKRMWYGFLRTYPNRVLRQKVIDNYIVDFYCHAAKLVIELDGSQHYTEEGLDYDNKRTKILTTYGVEVIRYSNIDVDKNFKEVCEEIDKTIKSRVGQI